MKIARYLLTFSCFVVFSSHAQKNNKANERLFDEFTASLNLTTSTTTYFPQGMHNRFGVGIGAYHGFRRGNIFTPLFGIELNYTAQYYDIMDVSESEQKRDLNIRGLNFSLPIDFRFNSLGKKKQFFSRYIILFSTYLKGILLCPGSPNQQAKHKGYYIVRFHFDFRRNKFAECW